MAFDQTKWQLIFVSYDRKTFIKSVPDVSVEVLAVGEDAAAQGASRIGLRRVGRFWKIEFPKINFPFLFLRIITAYLFHYSVSRVLF